MHHPLVPQTRSEAALPLMARGRVLGALSLQSDRPGAFDPDTVTILQTVADQLAFAVDNVRLLASSQQALEAARRAYAESLAVNLEELRAEGKYAIVTPDEALRRIREKGSINLSPLCGGMPIEYGWKSLELFAAEVAPHLDN